MCGICGIYAYNEIGRFSMINLLAATNALAHRGPDAGRLFDHHRCGLGHRRLAVIDLTAEANQPMSDVTERYTIVFNGEIYNFRQLRNILEREGIPFRTQSDTEVLLYWLIKNGTQGLSYLHGFFAFALYDAWEESLLLARDRMGIKPLLWYEDEDKFLFASELNALLAFGIPRQVDKASIIEYFQLHYIPAPYTALKNVYKLPPGHYIRLQKRQREVIRWYAPPKPLQQNAYKGSYQEACHRVVTLLEQSVAERMVADVPLGTFLSGGIDSSIITGLAKQLKNHLQTFSIGYQEEPFFDETNYAEIVARHFGTYHYTFKLKNEDLFEAVEKILPLMGEPFADSSAIPYYILSQRTRQHVTVALSGDGADELFGGYQKYRAEWWIRNGNWRVKLVKFLTPLLEKLPKSRNSAWQNRFRRMQRLAQAALLTPPERYWFLSCFMPEKVAMQLLQIKHHEEVVKEFFQRKARWQELIGNNGLNQVLFADVHLVLPNDMLHKADSMSMAHGLEVRVPFMDHRLVEFALCLPEEYKINRQLNKRILQEAFRNLLPKQLFNRPKKGFEVPLLKAFRTIWRTWIEKDLLGEEFIQQQGVFNPSYVSQLKEQLLKGRPVEQNHLWALVVFQHWWKRLKITWED
ncbi:MAG: asparagine synthase (glutamine-hydrolyzing) [Cytophagales bacterium]|nr:asparagine synthase (glutamine-hydrolyzing) [Bernardetiaceae bacterium]MDW8211059.1 asparagine synthase (glutamine-hydrolyzing) [Cytophagales bacterium]